MQFEHTSLPGVMVVKPRLFADPRGFFMETYHQKAFDAAGFSMQFIQDNHSRSVRGTLRGLHYQLHQPQGKLVRVVRGEIFDVAVDLRRSSVHFGRWIGTPLSEDNHLQMYIPPGFAHGFYVTSETADVVYKCTDFYDPASERTLLWNDPDVGIDWSVDHPLLSQKDAEGTPLRDAECYA